MHEWLEFICLLFAFFSGFSINLFWFKVKLVTLRNQWKDEEEKQRRLEFGESYGFRCLELIDRAEALGYKTHYNIYTFCSWAGVSSDDCAGPKWELGVRIALDKIEEKIKLREGAIYRTLENTFRPEKKKKQITIEDIHWTKKFFALKNRAMKVGWDGNYGVSSMCFWARIRGHKFLGLKSNEEMLRVLFEVEDYIEEREHELRN